MPGLRRFFHIERGAAGVTRAVDEELHFHFEMAIRELMENGMTPDRARAEAVRRFGDVEQTRKELASIDRARATHEQRAERWSAVGQDLRYALRGLRRTPGFAIAVIVTLALGIGVNATMFGIIDRLLFRPPTYLVSPDRVSRVFLASTVNGKNAVQSQVGYRRYADLRDATTSFDASAPFSVAPLPIGSGQNTAVMDVAMAGADLWRMFDVKPSIGRFFTAAEDAPPDGQKVVVVSHSFWQSRFGGRMDALGARIEIGSAIYTVIGVAPRGFEGFSAGPVIGFIPMSAGASIMIPAVATQERWYQTYHVNWFEVFVRRKPNVAASAAMTDLTNAYRRSRRAEEQLAGGKASASDDRSYAFGGPILRDRGPDESSEAKVATWLVGVAAIVLLIACANVANLLLVRALRRRREVAIRIALGVSHGRLIMQLMSESLLLAAFGGLAGAALAYWGGTLFRLWLLGDQEVAGAPADARVGLLCAALALVTGVLTGLAPAIRAGHADVTRALRSGARDGTTHRSGLRSGLLIVQAALSVLLLAGAGLFARSLANVRHVPLGYDADHVLLINLENRGVSMDSSQRAALRYRLVDRALQVPGVEQAAIGLTVPFRITFQADLFIPGVDSVSKLGEFTLQSGSGTLLATLGTRVIRGRGITAADSRNAPRVIVVTEAMAKRIWPSENAIGKCVRIEADTTPCFTVVGITEDVRAGSLAQPALHYYLSIEQFGGSDNASLYVRTRGQAADEADRVRRALQPAMPGDSYVTVTPMATIIGGETRSWQLGATMFSAFGTLALILAAIGLYSVIAYNVTQRVHEMGVRLALGAQRRDVISLILREGMWVVLPGVALGATMTLGTGHWIAPLLFQVSPNDPAVIAVVVGSLLGVAAIASLVPALRASRVDPNQALRAD